MGCVCLTGTGFPSDNDNVLQFNSDGYENIVKCIQSYQIICFRGVNFTLCQFFLMRRKRKLESRTGRVLGLICGINLEPNKSFYGIQNGPSSIRPHAGNTESTQRADFIPFEANIKP